MPILPGIAISHEHHDEGLFPIDREPQFTTEGWRGILAIGYAIAPGLVFAALVFLHFTIQR